MAYMRAQELPRGEGAHAGHQQQQQSGVFEMSGESAPAQGTDREGRTAEVRLVNADEREQLKSWPLYLEDLDEPASRWRIEADQHRHDDHHHQQQHSESSGRQAEGPGQEETLVVTERQPVQANPWAYFGPLTHDNGEKIGREDEGLRATVFPTRKHAAGDDEDSTGALSTVGSRRGAMPNGPTDGLQDEGLHQHLEGAEQGRGQAHRPLVRRQPSDQDQRQPALSARPMPSPPLGADVSAVGTITSGPADPSPGRSPSPGRASPRESAHEGRASASPSLTPPGHLGHRPTGHDIAHQAAYAGVTPVQPMPWPHPPPIDTVTPRQAPTPGPGPVVPATPLPAAQGIMYDQMSPPGLDADEEPPVQPVGSPQTHFTLYPPQPPHSLAQYWAPPLPPGQLPPPYIYENAIGHYNYPPPPPPPQPQYPPQQYSFPYPAQPSYVAIGHSYPPATPAPWPARPHGHGQPGPPWPTGGALPHGMYAPPAAVPPLGMSYGGRPYMPSPVPPAATSVSPSFSSSSSSSSSKKLFSSASARRWLDKTSALFESTLDSVLQGSSGPARLASQQPPVGAQAYHGPQPFAGGYPGYGGPGQGEQGGQYQRYA